MKSRIVLFAILVCVFLSIGNCFAQPKTSDFNDLTGSWLRPDGGYVLLIKAVDDQGNIDAKYLNPSQINVAKAKASIEEGQINIYVEMQDVGYPGSNYTLTYNKENDQLIGVYYHAVLKQKFDIYFVRR